MNIKDALTRADHHSDTSWLLMHVLKKPRAFFQQNLDYELNSIERDLFLHSLQRYQAGEPLAYILGEQPFHTITLKVTPDVLIPRSETELLVEFVLEHFSDHKNLCLADLGTGSGAIALSLATVQPTWKIIATDINEKALCVAQENKNRLQINNVEFMISDWCEKLPKITFNAIISNPPYIAADDPALDHSVQFYEPIVALIAEENGLAALHTIITHSKNYLEPNGLIVLEHGYAQGNSVRRLLQDAGYSKIKTHQDFAQHERFTTAQLINFFPD